MGVSVGCRLKYPGVDGWLVGWIYVLHLHVQWVRVEGMGMAKMEG